MPGSTAEALAELKDQQAHAADSGEYYALGRQIAALRASQPAQSARDQSRSADPVIKAMNDLAQAMIDLPARFAQIIPSAIESINRSLSDSLLSHAYTGRQYRQNILNGLGGTARGIGSQILDTGFNFVEGGILSKLGLGSGRKPTGARGDPLYMVADSSVTSAACAAAGAASGGGIWATLLHGLIPGFADGGDVAAGVPIMVGERGPEPFIPRTPGGSSPTIRSADPRTTS